MLRQAVVFVLSIAGITMIVHAVSNQDVIRTIGDQTVGFVGTLLVMAAVLTNDKGK